MQLPFEHLNLRRNPFCAVSLEEHAELAVVDVDEYVEWLSEPGRVLEFTGDHGRGKTTHLLAIRRHFRQAPYLRVTEQSDKPERPDSPVVFVDEAQFLSRRQARRLFDDGRSYVVSTHRRLGGVYRRAGLECRRVQLEGLCAGKLRAIARRRIEAARRGEGDVPRLGDDAIEALLDRFGDDLRGIEEHLYEVFQRLEQVRTVRVSDLWVGSGDSGK